jgi:hypothetical protein
MKKLKNKKYFDFQSIMFRARNGLTYPEDGPILASMLDTVLNDGQNKPYSVANLDKLAESALANWNHLRNNHDD